MGSKEIIFLAAQTLCILVLLAWIVVLSIKIRQQEYSYYYILVRKWFYGDRQPWEYLKKNIFFFYYAVQRLSLLFICFGLIEQIRDDTVYQKSPSFFIGTVPLAISVLLTINYFNHRIKAKR